MAGQLIRGRRTAPLNRAAPSTIERALAEIEKRALRSVAPEEVIIRSAYLVNDLVDHYLTQFTKRALGQIADEIAGLPCMRNHNTWGSEDLPVAAWLFGEVTTYKTQDIKGNEVTANAVLATHYMSRAGDVEGLAPRIDLGIIREVSFSWYSEPYLCSLCKNVLRSPDCKHVLGGEYEGETCIALMDGIEEGVEASIVWKGGQVGTKMVNPRTADAIPMEAAVRMLQQAAPAERREGGKTLDEILRDRGPTGPSLADILAR